MPTPCHPLIQIIFYYVVNGSLRMFMLLLPVYSPFCLKKVFDIIIIVLQLLDCHTNSCIFFCVVKC